MEQVLHFAEAGNQNALRDAIQSIPERNRRLLLGPVLFSTLCHRRECARLVYGRELLCNHGMCLMVLLEAGADPNALNDDGETLLYKAFQTVSLRFPNITSLYINSLLDAGANVNSINGPNGETPLYAACSIGDNDGVSILLGHGADPNLRSHREAPFHCACYSGDRLIAGLLLDGGANPDLGDVPGGRKGIHIACAENKDVFLRFLLNRGIQDSKDNDGCTALMVAIARRSFYCFNLLLTSGVSDVHAVNDSNRTALHCACAGNDDDLRFVKALIDRGANVNAKDVDYIAPLHLVCCTGSLRKLEALLAAGAYPNASDDDGNRALHIAVSDPEHNPMTAQALTRALLLGGADRFARNANRETPRDVAYHEIVKELLDNF